MIKKLISIVIVLLLLFSFNVSANFSDLPAAHWAHSSISDMVGRGILSGYPDGSFQPNRYMTRAEFAKVVAGVIGAEIRPISNSQYTDIKPTDWYAPYVAATEGYITGYLDSNGLTFQPNALILREDVAVTAVKIKGHTNHRNSYLDSLTDLSTISTVVRPYVALAIQHSLMRGYPDGSFKGQNPMTRAEVCTVLSKILNGGSESKVVLDIPEPTPPPVEHKTDGGRPLINPIDYTYWFTPEDGAKRYTVYINDETFRDVVVRTVNGQMYISDVFMRNYRTGRTLEDVYVLFTPSATAVIPFRSKEIILNGGRLSLNYLPAIVSSTSGNYLHIDVIAHILQGTVEVKDYVMHDGVLYESRSIIITCPKGTPELDLDYVQEQHYNWGRGDVDYSVILNSKDIGTHSFKDINGVVYAPWDFMGNYLDLSGPSFQNTTHFGRILLQFQIQNDRKEILYMSNDGSIVSYKGRMGVTTNIPFLVPIEGTRRYTSYVPIQFIVETMGGSYDLKGNTLYLEFELLPHSPPPNPPS